MLATSGFKFYVVSGKASRPPEAQPKYLTYIHAYVYVYIYIYIYTSTIALHYVFIHVYIIHICI